MKKIFILGLLISPIVARATDPVGPAAASGTAVVATASAPYATATVENGDPTQVVSASYVKGAYNDAIAAVNKVNADKQGKLFAMNDKTGEHDIEISTAVVSEGEVMDDLNDHGGLSSFADDVLVTARGALAGAIFYSDQFVGRQRVRAVTTWGSNNTTQLRLDRVN